MIDGVAKFSTLRRWPVFQDLDILAYAFAPEKSLRLAGRIFCLAIVSDLGDENV